MSTGAAFATAFAGGATAGAAGGEGEGTAAAAAWVAAWVALWPDGASAAFSAVCLARVAGVDGDGPSGARAIGRLALEMLETPSRCRLLGGRSLQLRVGLHCGPATAGVIGDMRFSYDVWGDAVNVAARMESHGVPNSIHVSEAFRTMTQSVFIFEERGTTDIKSIGPSQTFFLVGDQEQASQHQLGAASVNNAKQT